MLYLSPVKWNEHKLQENTIDQLRHLAAVLNVNFTSSGRLLKTQMIDQIRACANFDPGENRQCLLESKSISGFPLVNVYSYKMKTASYALDLPEAVYCIEKRPLNNYENTYIFKYNRNFEQHFRVHKNGKDVSTSFSRVKSTKLNNKEVSTSFSRVKSTKLNNKDISTYPLEFYAKIFDRIELIHVAKMISYLGKNGILMLDIKKYMLELCVQMSPKIELKYIVPK